MDAQSVMPNRLYGDLSYLWPVMSPPEDYAEEASYWRLTLRELLGSGRQRVLELGSGGGHNMSHLTAEFEATAVDLSEGMLAHSKRLNPSVEHHLGDMRDVRLGRKFAAVLIHDAIGYMLTEGDLRAAIATAAAHLEPGGVFITAPDDFLDSFQNPHLDHGTNADDDLHLTYYEYSYDPDPTDSTIETIYTYMINRHGRLQIEHDRHITGIFPKSTWARLITEAGFAYEERPYHLTDYHAEYILLVGRLQAGDSAR